MKKIGFTTSIPVEVIFAAGMIPVDLNNIFITAPKPSRLLELAEKEGFPRNTCAWIKGIYSSVIQTKGIDTIVSVMEGDCSNTRALSEVLETRGITCIPFSYPNSGDYNTLFIEINKLCERFGVHFEDAVKARQSLDYVRRLALKLDEMTWKDNKVSGFENHLWQVSCSDFNGDHVNFGEEISIIINEAAQREPMDQKVRLGYIGVPPVFPDIYNYLESMGARVVYNEVQRQFTMVNGLDADDIVEVYRRFTYPYALKNRLADIKEQIRNRGLDGVVHYTQAFCFRGIEDIIIRKELGVPVLTLEGDRPGELDSRTKLRIDAFVDMLKWRK